MRKIELYDTTLRDGTQREGISLSMYDKIKIARRLDEFGVQYIEGGWPGSNPKDAAFFEKVQDYEWHSAKIAAFGSTLRKGNRPEDDPNLQALIAADTSVVTLVGKSWDMHVTHVLETTLENNLIMIAESVAYLKSLGKHVIFDGEHFFDGYRADPEYTIKTVKVAAENGADMIVLCDTNGGLLPWEIEEIFRVVSARVDTPLGIHAHDDGGCGVANSLAGVQAGAVQVQGTINGYGERVGNANLCIIIPDLQIKMGYECVEPDNLSQLTELSRYVAEVANLPHERHQAFVGESAFAHKGGIHVAAIMKAESSYQHIDPQLVGNQRRTVVSELSGKGNVIEKSHHYGLEVSSEQARDAVEMIKDLESQGFTFESADGSVKVMLQRMQPDYQPPFELVDFMVVVENRQGRGIFSEATVKVKVGERIYHTAAEGNGPVNALDAALRKALIDEYPQIADTSLSDYKVRILDSDSGTSASVRVLIDTKNGKKKQRWSTVGASTNIIEASWKALEDSLEYALLNGESEK